MKPIPYKKLRKVLKDEYKITEFTNRAKGSERMFARKTQTGGYDQNIP